MSQERIGCFKERHNSYKTLVSHVAEQLAAEDLKAIYWHVDAPSKLRSGSALDILEYLERQGEFSEISAVFLSELLKKIKRNDLVEKVNAYSQNYGRHYSLPSAAVQEHTTETQRSYSVGSQKHQISAPILVLDGHADSSMEQIHPTQVGGPTMNSMHPASSVNSNNWVPQHQLESSPIQTSSLDNHSCLISDNRTRSEMQESPGLEIHQSNNWEDHRSLSNSSSIYFNYNSHPSSHNTSQEAMRLDVPRPSLSSHESSQYREPSYFNETLPLEFSNSMSMLPPAYAPPPPALNPWYRQASSFTNILQDSPSRFVSHPPPYDPKLMYHNNQQRYPFHNSTREAALSSNSQDSLASNYYRHSLPRYLPMHNVQYYTPPHDRRNTVTTMTVPHYPRDPPKRQRSVNYPSGTNDIHQSRKFPLPVPTAEQGQESEIPIGNNEVPTIPTSKTEKDPEIVTESIQHNKKCDDNLDDLNPPSEYDVPRVRTNSKNAEKIVGGIKGKTEVVERKRANSLHDADRKVRHAKNRLSYNSVDERHPRKEYQLLQSNAMEERSESADTNNSTGSTNLLEDTVVLREGASVQTSSTLNSEDCHNRSRTSSFVSSAPKAHRTKESLLGKLTLQFSKVVRPHKEIEWPIKRSKLNKLIYEQTEKFLTCPYKLELDGSMGSSNPKLTLYVHPYGREEDSNKDVTLEVGIDIVSRPKGQRMDSRAKVEVNVKAEDKEKRKVFGMRVLQESVRLNYFFIKRFISHQELKQSHSEYVIITICANLIFP